MLKKLYQLKMQKNALQFFFDIKLNTWNTFLAWKAFPPKNANALKSEP